MRNTFASTFYDLGQADDRLVVIAGLIQGFGAGL